MKWSYVNRYPTKSAAENAGRNLGERYEWKVEQDNNKASPYVLKAREKARRKKW